MNDDFKKTVLVELKEKREENIKPDEDEIKYIL